MIITIFMRFISRSQYPPKRKIYSETKLLKLVTNHNCLYIIMGEDMKMKSSHHYYRRDMNLIVSSNLNATQKFINTHWK